MIEVLKTKVIMLQRRLVQPQVDPDMIIEKELGSHVRLLFVSSTSFFFHITNYVDTIMVVLTK